MDKGLKYIKWALISLGFAFWASPAMATCPTFHSLTNGTTASASDVMDNYNYILNCPVFSGPLHLQDPTDYDWLNFERSGTLRWQLGLNGVSNGDMLVLSRFDTSGNSLGYTLTVVRATGDILVNGGTKIIDQSGNLFANHLKVEGVTTTGASGSGNILFGTSPTISSPTFSGNVGIDTSSPSYTLHVNGSVAGTSAYNNLSDVRLKKNIASIDDALALVLKIHGVRYEWRSANERTVGKDFKLPLGTPQIGFVAQDLQKVLPEAITVGKGNDAILSVQESKVVPVLVEAVKELKAANDQHTAQLALLRTQVSELQRKTGVRTALNSADRRR